jgi:glycyl-tRNA synthetase beta chain
MTHTVLFELGCEELPPKSLKTLRNALKSEVEKGLNSAGLSFSAIEAYAAPRRLALEIIDVDGQQADSQKRFDGPAVQAAYDQDGQPTKALEGFLRGQGIGLEQLSRFNAGKVEKVCYFKDIKGQSIDQLLPAILQTALDNLPIAKRMRSAASRTEFVRPVQWVLLLKDDQVIDATIQDLKTSNQSFGHRFHAPQAIVLKHADDYLDALHAAYVIADFDLRQSLIGEQVAQLAAEVDAQAIVPADLLDEVTALVEWPVALRASFEARYLAVPQEALITTMQDNQKYFCLVNDQGKLQPYFITISNIDSKDPSQIIAGNEKVVRPRLSDAEFFFLQDQKQPLASRAEKLKNMVFQAQLGTLWQKTERVAALSVALSAYTGADAQDAQQAALLSKCDLTSELVGEFPELQGIAGTYYARLEGENEEVSAAIAEQYLPKFAGDALPQSKTGTTLALADRLVTLVGIFGIGQAPTGSKDPFALRRSAIGTLRLMIENQLDVSLDTLVDLALAGYGEVIPNHQQTRQDAVAFLEGRYRAKYEDQGIDVDVIQAVQALSPKSPLDFEQRINAVTHFRSLPEAAALAAANKRVANILAKETLSGNDVDSSQLIELAEQLLFQALQQLQLEISPLLATRHYTEALSQLAALRQPIDAFFENVMVMAEDQHLRRNRLHLLAQLRALFTQVADISLLQS